MYPILVSLKSTVLMSCSYKLLLMAGNSQGQQQATKGQKGAYTSWSHFLMNLPLEM